MAAIRITTTIIARSKRLAAKGVHYIDMGTSGGVWGLERGYCLMIGGETEVVKHLDPIFATLAPGRGDIPRTAGREKLTGTAEQGYLHCGPSGAGHFVKMVHNGIEYGLMAAYAEGLNILQHANIGKASQTHDAETTPLRHPEHYQYDFDLAAITELWRRGSVVASWLLDLTAGAFVTDPKLAGFAGASRIPAKADGPWPRPTTKACPRSCSRRRSSSDSPRAAKTTSRIACSPRCASGSAAHLEKK